MRNKIGWKIIIDLTGFKNLLGLFFIEIKDLLFDDFYCLVKVDTFKV